MKVARDEAADAVLFTCEDNGMGIDKVDFPYIFDRFYRGKRVGQSNVAGMGLGLAFVKEMVELHDGRVEIESQTGEGTTCFIWLPAK